MSGLQMRYFVLKPEGDGTHHKASQAAMLAYADVIYKDNPTLALELRQWVGAAQIPKQVEAPAPPWPAGADHNAKRQGWYAFFPGRAREDHRFPADRRDLHLGYAIGWDSAQLEKL